MKRILALLLTLSSPVSATPWSVPDGQGGWKPNPDCTGSCLDTGIPNPPPTASPEPVPRDPRESDKLHSPTEGSTCYAWWDGRPQIWVLGTPPEGTEPVALCHPLQHPVGTALPRNWQGDLKTACAAGTAPREWCDLPM